ncbi:MAG: zinc-dependent alcohol dehydrogenase family protein [Candidatus Obscuribacter sp.]|nr:zinc-dependent alcohol dehydrogenase family protein [Candidatus Obscuribacter sp.]MBP6348414.1 zinc-dependent alcohol dehydrogenase family protein [Candidatus Obscuribacter sp.]
MQAMVFEQPHKPLTLRTLSAPTLNHGQVLVEITYCGVCRTDLHVVDGELTSPKANLIPGHEIVGRVKATAPDVTSHKVGDRVGIPWLAETCGQCQFCTTHRENLCDNAIFTGYTRDGGYATECVASAQFCFKLPDTVNDEHAAPMLCAGLIGWRTLKLAGKGKHLGIYGFGAAAHITIQIALHKGWQVYGFTRPGDTKGQEFAKQMGAIWAGDSGQRPPAPLDAALIFAPAGELVVSALKASAKGATIVCGGIHMSDIPSFAYDDLWQERIIRSVANLTREDATEFFAIAQEIDIKTTVTSYKLSDANQALDDLRSGKVHGAAVLNCQSIS